MRPGTESAPRVAVPNPLREIVMATASRDQLRRRVRHAWDEVNEHRIESQSGRLAWLVAHTRAAFATRPPAAEATELLSQLLDCATELRHRVAGTDFDHVAHLAATMIDICYGLGQTVDNPDARWLAVLPKVADAIAQAFGRDRKGIGASHQISAAISRKARSEFPRLVPTCQ